MGNARRTCSGEEKVVAAEDAVSKKRRVEPPTNHALDASNAACAAALSAADKASDAHDASNAAFTALQEHGEGARKVRRTALKALTCVPCGKPLACAVSFPCGHAIDEQCFLQKCFSVSRRPNHVRLLRRAVPGLRERAA